MAKRNPKPWEAKVSVFPSPAQRDLACYRDGWSWRIIREADKYGPYIYAYNHESVNWENKTAAREAADAAMERLGLVEKKT